MNLYLISQTQNIGYDTYDSAVVAAESEEAAKLITPDESVWSDNMWDWCATPDQVSAQLLGTALPGTESGVILASFNAG